MNRKERCTQIIEDQGPEGARALLGSYYGVEVENYDLVVGLCEASIVLGRPAEISWMIIAVKKDSVKLDAQGVCQTSSAFGLFPDEEDEDGGGRDTEHDFAYQADYQGSRTWFYTNGLND